jgi:hypothetical protein
MRTKNNRNPMSGRFGGTVHLGVCTIVVIQARLIKLANPGRVQRTCPAIIIFLNTARTWLI